MNSLQVQVKREFWEHRSLWIAPLVVAVTLLAAAAMVRHLQIGYVTSGGPSAQFPSGAPALFDLVMVGWTVAFYLTAAILASLHLLDCLYGERRDRSILFWKSLPVSDTRTVLVKFLVGLVIVPLGTFLLAALTSALAAGILQLRNRFAFHGQFPVWDALTWLRAQGITLYLLIAALCWYAPYAAYLMLASAWARRSPYVWALIPPVLLVMLEHLILGTDHIGSILRRGLGELMGLALRFNPEVLGALDSRSGDGSRLFTSAPDPAALLSSPKLWLGLLAAALMLALAIRLRRYRDDS